MTRRVALLLIAIGALLGCSAPIERSMTLDFCHPQVDALLQKANARFDLVVGFKATRGRVSELRIVDNFANLDVTQIEECFARWRLDSIPDRMPVEVRFRWQHMFGWVSMEMAWAGNRVAVSNSGDTCAYCR